MHPSASTICTSREILSFGYNTVEYWKWSYWFTPTVHSHNFGQFIPATYLVTSYPAPIYSYSSNHSIYTTNHKSMQSTNQPVNQSINQSITLYQLSDHLSTYQSITISINQSIYLSVYVCLSVYLSTYLSICLSVCVCLSTYIYPSIYVTIRPSVHISSSKIPWHKGTELLHKTDGLKRPRKPLHFVEHNGPQRCLQTLPLNTSWLIIHLHPHSVFLEHQL